MGGSGVTRVPIMPPGDGRPRGQEAYQLRVSKVTLSFV